MVPSNEEPSTFAINTNHTAILLEDQNVNFQTCSSINRLHKALKFYWLIDDKCIQIITVIQSHIVHDPIYITTIHHNHYIHYLDPHSTHQHPNNNHHSLHPNQWNDHQLPTKFPTIIHFSSEQRSTPTPNRPRYRCLILFIPTKNSKS